MTRSNQSLHTDGSRITIFWDTTSHQRPPRVSSLVGDRSSRNMSGEYDLKLDRIRKLLDASHGQGWAFVPRAPLTEQTLPACLPSPCSSPPPSGPGTGGRSACSSPLRSRPASSHL